MPEFGAALQAGWVGLAVALGVGLLVGIERERRKGEGDDRAAAGVRTFAITAFSGALARTLGGQPLVLVGALLVALLVVAAYWRSRSRDPGLTTELALFCIYLIGVQAAVAPALAAAAGAVLAGVLAARARLHRFSTRWLSEQELHDGLLLAALALVVLPLVPSAPLSWLGGVDPRKLAVMVLLILSMQALGHVALRAFGAAAGTALTGFLGGFVSSTATVAAFAGRVRTEPTRLRLLAGSAGLSGVATWTLALMVCAALSPVAALALAPVALAGAVGGLLFALPLCRGGRAASAQPAPPTSPAPASTSMPSRALRPREAVVLALVLAAVAAFVGLARQRFGDAGLMASVTLTGLADAHAAVVTLASMHAAGGLDAERVVVGTLASIGANTLVRLTIAGTGGGPAFAWRVAQVLVGSYGAALLAWRLL